MSSVVEFWVWCIIVQISTLSWWSQINFGIMKRPQKFETISHLIWHLLSKRQIRWKIISKFVAFLENLNFNDNEEIPRLKESWIVVIQWLEKWRIEKSKAISRMSKQSNTIICFGWCLFWKYLIGKKNPLFSPYKITTSGLPPYIFGSKTATSTECSRWRTLFFKIQARLTSCDGPELIGDHKIQFR